MNEFSTTQSKNSDKMTIICVDDEPMILKSLRQQLRGFQPNCHIQVIQSSRAALALIKERAERNRPYALLIVDNAMPEMRGDELLSAVTQLSPKTYQVLLTGQINGETMGRIINQSNLFRFLAKPWQAEELKLIVSSALESFQRDQALSEQKEMNQKLSHQLRQAQTVELLSHLSSEIAHDFNNLLNIVTLSIDSLKIDLDDIRAYLSSVTQNSVEQLFVDPTNTIQDVRVACEQAQKMAQQLLGLSKDTEGVKANFELCQNLENTLKLLQRLIPDSIKLNYHASEHPLWIHADENALQRVIMNLVINARDAIGAQGQIRVSVDSHTVLEERECTTGTLRAYEYAHIQVADNGAGISNEQIDKIFEPFFSSKGDDGTGLGLTIVYQVVVSSLKGVIDVSNDDETIFHLFIPLLQSASTDPLEAGRVDHL